MTDKLTITLNAMTANAEMAQCDRVERAGDLYHLRPTARGITVVSTSQATPQMGFAVDKWKGVDQITWKPLAGEPGRDTPEKQVQAFLVHAALANGRRLPAELAPPDCTMWLLVDELVVQSQDGAGGSRRGDIIAVCEHADGRVWPAFVELKSKRESAELQRQVAAMHVSFFEGPSSQMRLDALHAFARVVLSQARPGILPKWSVGPHRSVGVMVWPGTNSSRRQVPNRVKDCPEIALRVVGYAPAFTFTHEAPSVR